MVRAGVGQILQVVGSAHRNDGTFEATDGGTFAFDYGGFIKSRSGRKFPNSGRLIFPAAVNLGQINVTFGTSNVHGGLTTFSGGRVIFSGNGNMTFYDTVDMQPGSELRVSSGSIAVFFGQVSQRIEAVFSGAGSKFYEGGLSVGASPGPGSDAGDVSFGSGNHYLAEIGGIAAGTSTSMWPPASSGWVAP